MPRDFFCLPTGEGNKSREIFAHKDTPHHLLAVSAGATSGSGNQARDGGEGAEQSGPAAKVGGVRQTKGKDLRNDGMMDRLGQR